MMGLIEEIKSHFDLRDDPSKFPYLQLQSAGKAKNSPSVSVQIVFFITVVIGVFVSPFLASTVANGKPEWPLPAPTCGWWFWLFYSPLVAAVLFPWVYKYAADRRKTVIVQICLFFSYGVAWNLVVSVVLNALIRR